MCCQVRPTHHQEHFLLLLFFFFFPFLSFFLLQTHSKAFFSSSSSKRGLRNRRKRSWKWKRVRDLEESDLHIALDEIERSDGNVSGTSAETTANGIGGVKGQPLQHFFLFFFFSFFPSSSDPLERFYCCCCCSSSSSSFFFFFSNFLRPTPPFSYMHKFIFRKKNPHLIFVILVFDIRILGFGFSVFVGFCLWVF